MAKADGIVPPDGELGNLELADVLDVATIEPLLADFQAVVHLPTALVDLRGKIHAGVNWQTICTPFRCNSPEPCNNCVESGTRLCSGIAEGTFKLYKCKNQMWDVATPIVVGGKHLGNLFCGQFLFEDDVLDREDLCRHAKQHSLDEKEYLATLN